MKSLSAYLSVAVFSLSVLGAASAFAGMEESTARQICRKELSGVLPGARIPTAHNLADGSVSHYLVWEGKNTISRSNGKAASASCVLNLESQKLYLTVSGKDYPAKSLKGLDVAVAR